MVIAYGYCRVSSQDQGATGYGLHAQREAIQRYCDGRGWDVKMIEEVASTRSARPLLDQAIGAAQITRGALVVARLDRLSRSVGEFASLMDRAQREKWAIVCLDPSVDLTTPYGRAMAGMAAVFAQLERELISQRTKEGLAAAIARGARPGSPPSVLLPEVKGRIIGMMDRHTAAEIARTLDLNPHTVRRFVRRHRQRLEGQPLT